jgi:hypothetical protein
MFTSIGLRLADGSYYDNFHQLGWLTKVGGLNPHPCLTPPAAAARASFGQPPSSTHGRPSILGHPCASSRHRPPVATCLSSVARMPLAGNVHPRPPIVDRPTRPPVVIHPPATCQPLLQVPIDEDPGSPMPAAAKVRLKSDSC